MLKIGEFSKLSHLTVKALRFYEKEGITGFMKPASWKRLHASGLTGSWNYPSMKSRQSLPERMPGRSFPKRQRHWPKKRTESINVSPLSIILWRTRI